jgi:hypothetical protein
LDKCIQLCDTNGQSGPLCVSTATHCGFAGDSVDVTYKIEAKEVSSPKEYATFALYVKNELTTPFDFSVNVFGGGFIVRSVRDFEAVTYRLEPNQSIVFDFILFIDDCANQYFVRISQSTGRRDEPILFNCNDLTCSCEDAQLQIFDSLTATPDNESGLIVTFDPKVQKNVTAEVKKTFLIGSISTGTGLIECASGQTPITNTATLKPLLPQSPRFCGPTICPVEDKANFAINCSRPTITVTNSLETTYSDTWCVCKSGEIIKKCLDDSNNLLLQDGPDCVSCPTDLAKWTLNLSGSTEQKTEAKLSIKITPNGCTPPYSKTIYYRGFLTSSGNELFSGEELFSQSEITIDITNDNLSGVVNGSDVKVEVYYYPQTYNFSTCEVVQTSTEEIFLYQDTVKFEETCNAVSTSILKDSIHIELPTCALDYPLAYPIQNSNQDCDIYLTDNTKLEIGANFVANPTSNYSKLKAVLENIFSSNGVEIVSGIYEFLQFPDFDPCDDERPPITITFFTKIPECACKYTNKATVENTPSNLFTPGSSKTTSTSSVSFTLGRCEQIVPPKAAKNPKKAFPVKALSFSRNAIKK